MSAKSELPLRIFAIGKAREFTSTTSGTGLIGSIVSNRRYRCTQVSRDASILHLSEHHGDGSPGQHLRVVVQDVAAFHHELSVKDYGYMKPGLQTAEWGERSVTVIDPFGNHLIYYEKTVSK